MCCLFYINDSQTHTSLIVKATTVVDQGLVPTSEVSLAFSDLLLP